MQSPRDSGELSLRVIRQFNSLWQGLPHKAAGVLICSTLPGILRVAKEHLDICSQSESLVISHFLASVPGERLIEFPWELSGMFDQPIDHRLGILASALHQHDVSRMTPHQLRHITITPSNTQASFQIPT